MTARETTANAAAAWGPTILRLVVGLVFVMHGGQKLFVYGLDGAAGAFAQMGIPFAATSAALATFTELLGGLALIAGVFTRWVTIPLAVTMLVALFKVHLAGGFFLPNGYEFVLVLLAGLVSVGLTGPGALAVDNVLAARRGGARASAPIGRPVTV